MIDCLPAWFTIPAAIILWFAVAYPYLKRDRKK